MKYQVKLDTDLQPCKDHHCYGYIINRTFRGQMMSERNILVSVGVYIKNKTIHGRFEIRNFASSYREYFTRPLNT